MAVDDAFLLPGGALKGKLFAHLVGEPAGADERKADQRVGERIGPYLLVRLLGSGGMGDVYLAERTQENFTQQVAFKLVRAELASEATRQRFERERQILAGLTHPNIAALLDVGQAPDGQPYYTMEYVQGAPIAEYCREHLASVDGRVRLLVQVAQALAHAHRNLTIHRDIKTSNILVREDRQVKLLDFGIAKLVDAAAGATLTQAAVGPMTPEYAAPEQFRSGPITVATDIYQFGILCFRVLSGRLPYRADPTDSYGWSRAVAEEEPLVLSRALDNTTDGSTWSEATNVARTRRQLTRDLDAIVRKALAKQPQDRYGSMDAMITDLEAYLDGRPVLARRAGAAYFAWRYLARRPYATAAGVLAIFALIATALIALQQASSAEREAARANAEAKRATAVADFLVGLFQVADPGVNRGEKLNANQILERGSAQVERELAGQPALNARLTAVIGDVYSALGDFERARPPLEHAIALMRADAHGNPTDLGHALLALSWELHRHGQDVEANKLLDEAEPKLQGTDARSRQELATLHSRRALAFRAAGRASQARAEFQTGLVIAGDTELRTTAPTAAIHNNYGILLRDQGDLEDAQKQFEEALSIYNAIFGEDHYRTVGTIQNLAMVMIDLGKLDDAKGMLERTGAKYLQLFGEGNPTYASSHNMLGNIARKQGRYEEALAHYDKAERGYLLGMGARHPFVAFPMFNAGETEFARGNYAAALVWHDKALNLRREILPVDHPDLADSLDSRSQVLLALSRFADARKDAEDGLTIRRAKLPADNPAIVRSLLHAGLAAHFLSENGQARVYWDEALERAPRAYARDLDAFSALKRDIADPAQALTRAER